MACVLVTVFAVPQSLVAQVHVGSPVIAEASGCGEP
jgi:hypothetical protein